MSCCGECNRGDIFNCNKYLDIADKYVDYARVANKCEDTQKEKLLWYGMAFWLMGDSNTVNHVVTPLAYSLLQTACLENDCDTIRGLARLLSQNCK
jgi:hypothetical protein